MTFYNTRLPDKIAAGFSGGPEFRTSIAMLQNGDEYRNKDWVYPRHRYSAELGIFDDTDHQALLGALMLTAGAWGTFRFKDWNDYTVTDSPLTVTAATSNPVQLSKVYTFAGSTFTRPLALIVSATVYEDGVEVAGTYSGTTGLFTPTDPWGAGEITWSGEFDVLVRFANDYNPLTARHRKARVQQIEIVEVAA
jgi:uncharacterized protein (TIGR02217 family)